MGYGLSEVLWGQCTLCLLKTVLKYSLVVEPWCQQHVEMCSMAFKSSDWEGEDHDAKLQEMLFQPKSGYCGHMYWGVHCRAEKGCAHLSACKSWTGANDSEECISNIPWWVWSTDGWRVLMPAENALHQNIATVALNCPFVGMLSPLPHGVFSTHKDIHQPETVGTMICPTRLHILNI